MLALEGALLHFALRAPARPQDSPHPWNAPRYGAHIQDANALEVGGTFLYYGRALESTMLVAFSTLSSNQSKSTKQALIAMTQLLNYCATHPDAVVNFRANNMGLHIGSNVSYLSESKGRSWFAGFH
jgi:hypothetical protein